MPIGARVKFYKKHNSVVANSWQRYEELLSNAPGTTIIGKKEFRDGLGAVIKSNGDNVNLTASRVDDNGVLKIAGGVASENWNLKTCGEFLQFVHGLWSQTHRRDPSSNKTEPAINNQSTSNGEGNFLQWGFLTITYAGGPSDDFNFEYQYNVDTSTNYLTVAGLPVFERYDTRSWREQIKLTTKNGASLPNTTPQVLSSEVYYLDSYTSTNEKFKIETASGNVIDFENGGDGNDSLWIKSPWSLTTYIKEISGDVTFDTFSFRVHIAGDSEMKTVCEVRYKPKAAKNWKRATNARVYRARNCYESYKWQICGCIIRLNANTLYDVEFKIKNTSGVYVGNENKNEVATIKTNFRTRTRPVNPSGGTIHQPTTLDQLRVLLGCNGTTGTTATAGDVIKIPSGDFSDANGTNKLDGISVSGIESNPILIQGEGDRTILPRFVFSDDADWLTFSDFQICNWFSSSIGSTSKTQVFSVKANCNSRGVVFQNCKIKNASLPTDIHGAAIDGKRYDGHGGFFLGGTSGQVLRDWLIEDCLIELGSYPDFDSVENDTQDNGLSVRDCWTPGEAFDNRTLSSVFSFCRFHNLYESGYGHNSGSGGKSISRNNVLDHCEFYAIYDDLFEFDHSEGGNIHYHCKSWHGANWKNTNLNGVAPILSKWHWQAQPRYYDQYTVSNATTVDNYNAWDVAFQSNDGQTNYNVSVRGNNIGAGHVLRQRNYKQYTITDGQTFNVVGHGYQNGNRVCFIGSQSAAVPSQLSAETYNLSSGKTASNKTPTPATFYFVVNASENTFQISETLDGDAINNVSDPGANGRYVADVDFFYTWAVRRRIESNNQDNLKCQISTRLAGSYPNRDEYNNTIGPDQNFPVLFCGDTRAAFAGYRIASAQDSDTGSIPNWLINNQHTGAANQSGPDAGFKWRGSVNHSPLNIVGTTLQTQYKNGRMNLLAKQSAFFASCIWLRSSSGFFYSNVDDITSAPTESTTVGGKLKYNFWDRNAYFNLYTTTHNKDLIGVATIKSMFENYGIDQNSVELLIPSNGDRVSDDIENVWQQSNAQTKNPSAGFWAPVDIGTRYGLIPNDSGKLYDAGPTEEEMPGVQNLLGPFLNNEDTGNVSFLATKNNNRRDIGPTQKGIGDTPTGQRSFVDFLSFYLPDGWTIQNDDSDFSELGINATNASHRLTISNDAGTAAIMVEHEERN